MQELNVTQYEKLETLLQERYKGIFKNGLAKAFRHDLGTIFAYGHKDGSPVILNERILE